MRSDVALGVAAALLVYAPAARAQGHHRAENGSGGGGSGSGEVPGSKGDAGPLNLSSVQLGSVADARAAREKMDAGDCAGALDLFDRALTTSADPTLRRDRGECHEKLGQPYPAMDDYRAYVTAAPDAPDASRIREKLDRLEEDTSGASRDPAAANDDVPPPERIGTDASESEPARGAGAQASEAPSASSASGAPDVDEDEAEWLRSPVRAARGMAIAPLFEARKWFRDGASVGSGETWAENVGVEVRYSTSSRGAAVLDVAYEHFDSSGTTAEVVSGLSSMFLYEFRFPLNARYDDQLTLAPGVGYEQLGYTPGDSNASGYSEGGLTGGLRFGYRHTVERTVALDVGLQGGAAYFLKFDSAVDGHDSIAGWVGARVALLWGL
jgi:hypothetical protein